MVLKGIVENVVFQNKENGFTVARVSANHELITIVGKLSNIFQGQEITATGNFITDARWGEQFKIDTYTIKEPKNEMGIIRYLSSGLLKGIGPITAERIVEKFGSQTLDIIELSPLKLAEVRGITMKKAAEIGAEFIQLRKMQDVVMFLQNYNISTNMAIKIFNRYGDNAREILKTNPYNLVEDMA